MKHTNSSGRFLKRIIWLSFARQLVITEAPRRNNDLRLLIARRLKSLQPSTIVMASHSTSQKGLHMDFEYSDKVKELRKKLLGFMDEHVYPNEHLYHKQIEEGDRWQPTEIIEELKPKARAVG